MLAWSNLAGAYTGLVPSPSHRGPDGDPGCQAWKPRRPMLSGWASAGSAGLGPALGLRGAWRGPGQSMGAPSKLHWKQQLGAGDQSGRKEMAGGWEYSSVSKCLPSMREALLSSNPSNTTITSKECVGSEVDVGRYGDICL